MAKYMIGSVIYENRTRRKITQEELCHGICTQTTLSRIENGVQMPRRKILEALMQRLGLQMQYYFFPVSNEEMERSNLEYAITRKLSHNEYDITDLLERYKKCSPEMDHMEEQFYLYAFASQMMRNENDYLRALSLLLQGIALTIPEFSQEHLCEQTLLTFDEIRIINGISLAYYEIGQYEQAKKFMLFLKEYLHKTDIDLEEKAKLYPMILFNLSNWMGLDGRNEQVYELCNEGIEFCIKSGQLTVFPYLIFNKAYSLAKMNRLEEALPVFRQACTIFEALKDTEKSRRCRAEVQNAFSVEL